MTDYHENLTNATLKWLEHKSIRKHIFHYTKQVIATSIISTRPPLLRSYDIWTMKDVKEFHFSFEEFFKLAKRRGLHKYIHPVEIFYQNELKNPTFRYFVTSFTGTHLKYKHWTHYAQKYSGVCLKLRPSDPQIVGKTTLDMLMGASVIYNQTIQSKLLNRLFDHYKANAKRIEKGFSSQSIAGNHFSRLNIGLYQALVVYGLIFKTRKYKWEDEYRLVSMVSDQSLIKLCRATSRHYVDLSIPTNTELYYGKHSTKPYPGCPIRVSQLG